MDIEKSYSAKEIKIYLGTIHGLLKMIDSMKNPTVNKIRDALNHELITLRTSIENQMGTQIN